MKPEALVARAADLARDGHRAILGITGAPGAGKSTLAAWLVESLGPKAAYVPMDGFHLSNVELERRGLRPVKGAIGTFDGHGFLALLRRIRDERDATVFAPDFDRTIEEPVAGRIPIPPHVALVVTEGNYLLIDRHPWSGVAGECDQTWYVEVDESTRVRRLVDRHVGFGMAPDDADAWARGTDQRNAELVTTSRDRADLLIRPETEPVRSLGSVG